MIKNDLAQVDLEQLKEWLNANTTEDKSIAEEEEEEDSEAQSTGATVVSTTAAFEDEGVTEVIDEEEEEILDSITVKGDHTSTFEDFYPTPPQTPPPGDLLAAAFHGMRNLQGTQSSPTSSGEHPRPPGPEVARRQRKPPRQSAGSATITIAEINVARAQPGSINNLHQSQLPAPPKRHHDLVEPHFPVINPRKGKPRHQRHPLADLFLQAERDHLQSHEKTGSWEEVSRHSDQIQGNQILDCMWVYTYKFNTRGFLAKCKARLVVRGDQQRVNHAEENYAATLAVRSFRAVLALAARFDLELKQFDAVNAFVNAKIDEDVYMEMPTGYRRPSRVLKLKKALYGLRKSPLLWQKELTATLTKLGFKALPHEPCMMIRKGCLIFFYVDDIVVAYRKNDSHIANAAISGLKAKYELTGGEDLRWFLGIEIHRDRARRYIWLSQTAYIDKIAELAQSDDLPRTPMGLRELQPYEGIATRQSTRLYQRKVGSILYTAVITRPDVAFAVARLARFNQNPGPEHHRAADQVLRYLHVTRSLALRLGGGDYLRVASDASFADNSIDRKSSQGYAITLFGGLIAWRASKQDTVTTSTTEAELLALAQAAKEGLFIQRLIAEMAIKLDDDVLVLECDNTNTISLVTKEIAVLQTKLRHVDIHNHWLRQEYQRGKIHVKYVPSKKMVADGLTKALNADNHQEFPSTPSTPFLLTQAFSDLLNALKYRWFQHLAALPVSPKHESASEEKDCIDIVSVDGYTFDQIVAYIVDARRSGTESIISLRYPADPAWDLGGESQHHVERKLLDYVELTRGKVQAAVALNGQYPSGRNAQVALRVVDGATTGTWVKYFDTVYDEDFVQQSDGQLELYISDFFGPAGLPASFCRPSAAELASGVSRDLQVILTYKRLRSIFLKGPEHSSRDIAW
ncbi:hypothetical protein CHGG_06127 [Chaetomium globosum CBS 148.51]|uniref:Reverse transcriptase Ty1/copia-type domain-containing protein n=1 Tax=Chaetomium globosum (strain ATCC 6205 / CBS 148.51 / DSM 1962 / NBRC 6347 / NRRL 1970) TaxID=306901 RepID=Q2H5D8_CHAGB|nr:uncharacterized protein CHGG_06127 [Chaetomium globosum CBS 148.51]EAQ89508.1 hypothetical protein CHGG_06127 [Chaetomium globosum CBS 148.51]